jgi:hypothetical protein
MDVRSKARSAGQPGASASIEGLPDRDALLDFHARMTDRFAALLRTVEDGSAPVPRLTWSVAEVGAHVLSGLRGYRNGFIGAAPAWSATPHGQNENDALLALAPERDPVTLAAAVSEAGESFRAACRERTGETLRWHGGIEAPWVGVVGASAGEIMVHGWDIARACAQPWPITAADADLYLASSIYVTPYMVDTAKAGGFTATFELKARGGSSTTLQFDNGSLTVSAGHPARADCRVLVEPVSYTLSVVMGRIPQWKPILTGKVLAYGRRPWLGMKLRPMIHRV